MMIDQKIVAIEEGFYTCITKGICTANCNNILVVFFHGFSQTMSGSYGLYKMMAKEVLKKGGDFLSFDLPGFGDSEGRLVDYTFSDWVRVAKKIVKSNMGSNTHLVFLGNASGNILALEVAKSFNVHNIILLEPYEGSFQNTVIGKKILGKLYAESSLIINTSDLGAWKLGNEMDSLFSELGGGLNRSKGLVLQKDLLIYLLCYDVLNALQDSVCDVTIYHNGSIRELGERDNLFMDMLNREKVLTFIKQIALC